MKHGKYSETVRKHLPAGYELKLRAMSASNGFAEFKRCITLDSSLEERAMLFVFLHECGHVHLRHLGRMDKRFPAWRQEYEADQYAIKAMKADDIPIPRKHLEDHKSVLREYIDLAHDKSEVVDDEVLRYAYGRQWRKHRL